MILSLRILKTKSQLKVAIIFQQCSLTDYLSMQNGKL